MQTGIHQSRAERGIQMDSCFYLKVRAHYTGADGNLVPRMRPVLGTHPCLPVVTSPVPARMSLRRIRGTRVHCSTFMVRCDQKVMAVRRNDDAERLLKLGHYQRLRLSSGVHPKWVPKWHKDRESHSDVHTILVGSTVTLPIFCIAKNHSQ